MTLSSQNQVLLDFLLDSLANAINREVDLNNKVIRDMLDPTEGLLRGIVNGRGNYDHGTFRYAAPYLTQEALTLRKSGLSRSAFGAMIVRDHVIPLKIIRKELQELKPATPNELANFISQRIRSVLITKEQDAKLNQAGLKSSMPVNWDQHSVFARYTSIEAEVVYSPLG